MKKIKLTFQIIGLAVLVGLLSTACDSDDIDPTSILPNVESITLAANDSLVVTGFSNNMYLIRGSGFSNLEKIYFNETDTYFNPTLVTDNAIFVTVAEDTPYKGANNNLVLKTSNGSTSYSFPIGAPPPVITSFTPLAAGAGDIVTIKGAIFDNLLSVRFGDIEAKIVSSTETEIKVEVPAGVVQSFLFVETSGGITQSTETFGFKYLIYDDALAEGWWVGGWDGTQDFVNTEQVKRGDFAAKRTYTGGYSGFQIGNGGDAILLSDYQAIKVSIYGGAGIGDVKVVLNGSYDDGKVITIVEGEWTNFTIPLSELGNVSDTLNEIVIQEFSGSAPSIIYIDDLGLI
ncbi:MAG: IPT/TIG domain-containing protein [Leeuwenhoekiella sp.]